MNERILELYKESFGEDPGRPGSVEKFAKLIVLECANVCYDHSNAAGGVDTHFGYGYKDCGDDIKKTFGVEL